jgi:Flp pilus assembly pilin Flp
MKKLLGFYNRIQLSQLGAVAAEYAILVSLVAIAIITGATALGVAINNALETAAAAIP